MITIADKTKCCGCTACYSICPKGCVSMQYDDEGFLYPVVDTNACVNCHICERVCPYTSNNGIEQNNSVFCAVQNTNEEERLQSTAGGFFSIVAEEVIRLGGVVYAVGYNERTEVVHKCAKSIEQLSDMRGSKYVQSNLCDTFNEIKELLLTNTLVLFVGTPCQVHGLINAVGVRENLYTIDLLCLGVSSPGIFQKYISYLNEKYKNRVTEVQFRNKYFGYATPNVRVCFENNKYIQQTFDSKSYANLFFKKHLNTRPSCYECQFREIPRVSDFTIGDFSEIGKIDRSLDDDKGTTKLWMHSEKAKKFVSTLSDSNMLIVEKETANVIGGTKKQINIPDNRNDFFYDATTLNYPDLVKKWCPDTIKSRIISALRYVLIIFPFGSKVFKCIKKIKIRSFNKNVKKINKNER